MKHLLFGVTRDCHAFAKDRGWNLDDYKVVKHPHDFYGYSDVELHYLGRAETVNEYELYHEARKYFISKGVIEDV